MTTAEKELRDILGLKSDTEGRKNYSVKAGAGGGKTTLLSKRICRQILEGTPIEEFVIITYTNAAATELREKITTELRKLISNGDDTEDRISLAKAALNTIELMQISTIHSFLFKILRENAFEAGIVMDAAMLEDSEDDARREKFFNDWYKNPEKYKEIEAFGDMWVYTTSEGYKSDYKRDVFYNMFNSIANVREEIVYDLTDHSAKYEQMAKEYIDKWYPKMKMLKDTIIDNAPLDKAGNKRAMKAEAKKVHDSISMVENKTNKGITEAVLVSVGLGYAKKIKEDNLNIFSRYKEPIPEIDAIIDDIYDSIPEYDLEWDFKTLYEKYLKQADDAAKVVDYVCNMQKEYQKRIDEETRVLSNDDILFRAEKLLSGHEDILDKIRNQYSKIYVDEFQDTTGLQTRIVKLITGKAGSKASEDDFADDKLLVVGDPKQSIYRFTGAEKAVYDEMDSTLGVKTNSESVSLDSNFRSNEKIVNWVNNSFSRLMPGGYSPMETDWRIKEDNALSGVYRYSPEPEYNANGNETKYNQARDIEEVASVVERLVGKPYCFVEECNRQSDGTFLQPTLRPIQYSDIMIICKTTTAMSKYVERFAEKGIPVNVQGKFRVDKDEVLRNFALLVEYYAGYKNKKKLYTAIQVISGEDISDLDIDKTSSVTKKLNDLRTYFSDNNYDAPAIIKYLERHEELFVPKGIKQTPERVRTYRIRLHQMIENCLNNNDGDLSSYVELMNEYIENNVKREIPLESNENAIRFMNVHQSKGLTGQIVIIACRSGEEKCRYGGFKKAGKYYPSVTYSVGGDKTHITVPTYGYDINLMKQVYKEEMEESIRLQYVAATRAAHALIIMPVAFSKPWFTKEEYEYELLPDLNEWIKAREEDDTEYNLKAISSDEIHRTVRLQNLYDNIENTDYDVLSRNRVTGITPSSLEPSGSTGYGPMDLGYVKENRPGAYVFGTVMHRVYQIIFERYDRINNSSASDKELMLEQIINQAIIESMEDMRATDKPQEFVDFLKPKMIEYIDKVIKPIVDSAKEIYPEYTFSFYVANEDRDEFLKSFDKYFKSEGNTIEIKDEPIWINGQADLVVVQKDGRVKVYDYKSDTRNGKPIDEFEKSLEGKYSGQLALYKYALSKAFNVEDVDTELIHLYR